MVDMEGGCESVKEDKLSVDMEGGYESGRKNKFMVDTEGGHELVREIGRASCRERV